MVSIIASDLQPGVRTALSPGAWLEASPRGAYTTARTINHGRSVFELSFHIHRLATSAKLMLDSDVQEGQSGAEEIRHQYADALHEEAIRPRIIAALQHAITAYYSSGEKLHNNNEVKLTILISWPNGNNTNSSISNSTMLLPTVQTHASAMGPPPPPPIKVHVRGAPRHNALAKDSDWVRKRKSYESEMGSDVNEVVLVSRSGSGTATATSAAAATAGCIMEGLSSNFFALIDGKIYTADEGVLKGSVREVVLDVAANQGVEVVLMPPRLSSLMTPSEGWQGAFLTSTSRLLLPIDEMHVFTDTKHPLVVRVSEDVVGRDVIQRLRDGVMAEIEKKSEPVFTP